MAALEDDWLLWPLLVAGSIVGCVVVRHCLGGLLLPCVQRRLAAPPLPCRRPAHANRHRLLYFFAGLVGRRPSALQTQNQKTLSVEKQNLLKQESSWKVSYHAYCVLSVFTFRVLL